MSSNDIKIRNGVGIAGIPSQEGQRGDAVAGGGEGWRIEFTQGPGDSFILSIPPIAEPEPRPPNPLFAMRNPYTSAGDVAHLYGTDGRIPGRMTAENIRARIWRVYDEAASRFTPRKLALTDPEKFALEKLDRKHPIREGLPPGAREFVTFLREAFVGRRFGTGGRVPLSQTQGLGPITRWKRLSGDFELLTGGKYWELKCMELIDGFVPKERALDAIILANGMLREEGFVPLEPWMLGANKREIFIFRLRQLAAVIGHTPTVIETRSAKWMASPLAYQREFKAYSRAMRAAGLPPNGGRRTREEILHDLRTFAGVSVGDAARAKDLIGRPGVPSAAQIARHFGTIGNALSAVGASTSHTLSKGRRMKPAEFMDEIRMFTERHGEPPEIRITDSRSAGRDHVKHRIVYGLMAADNGGHPVPRPGHELYACLVVLKRGESLPGSVAAAPPPPVHAGMPSSAAPGSNMPMPSPFAAQGVTVTGGLGVVGVTSTISFMYVTR